MAVVILIGTMVGLAAPAMMNAFGDARASELAGHMVNVFNTSRARAMGSGRSQLVRFTQAANSGQGGLIAYEGNNSSCNASNWAGIIAAGCGPAGFCTQQLNPLERQIAGDVLQIGLLTTAAANNDAGFNESDADICFEPTGVTFWRAGSDATSFALMSSENGAAGGSAVRGGFLFRVQRLNTSGTETSITRELTVPLGAAARTVL